MIRKWYTIEVSHNGIDWVSVGTEYWKKSDAIEQYHKQLRWYKDFYRDTTTLRMIFHREESFIVEERNLEKNT